jgi:hypothetical protein
MRILVSGWSRNQGNKDIMDTSLEDVPVADEKIDHYSWDQTYLQIREPIAPWYPSGPMVRVSVGTKLNLGGSYLLRVELSRKEIARLFYLTHPGVRELDDILRLFAKFKDQEDGGAAA